MKDRILPHNIDMEESVLSSLLLMNDGFEKIESLKPEDFYNSRNGLIFETMLSLRLDNLPIDVMTVSQRLEQQNKLDDVGGHAYITNIEENAPYAMNIYAYAKSITDLSMIRDTILSCMRIIEDGYSTPDAESFVNNAQEHILSLQTTNTKDKFYNMSDLMKDALERINNAQKNGFSGGLDFGMPTITDAMKITGSKLIIVAGRPAMGKTALMLSIAKFLAYQGEKCGIIEIEMDKEALADRMLGEEANVNPLCFYARNAISDQSKKDIGFSASGLSNIPIVIDDSQCKIEDVVRKCRKMKKDGCKIIFIDQLSKISYTSGLSEFQGYSRNCSRLADLKKELRIPIVLLCQLNRGVETRQKKMPQLSDLKQTGQIEEDADIVFFLYRPGYYEEIENPGCDADQSRTQIILAKNRNGALGVETQVLFNSRRGMFTMLTKGV